MSGPDVLSVTLFGGKTMVTVVLAVINIKQCLSPPIHLKMHNHDIDENRGRR